MQPWVARPPPKTPAFHDAGVTATFGGARYVDFFTDRKEFAVKLSADFNFLGIDCFEFLENREFTTAGDLKMAGHGLIDMLALAKTELQGRVSVFVLGLLLHHSAGTGLDDRHRNGDAFLDEYASHFRFFFPMIPLLIFPLP